MVKYKLSIVEEREEQLSGKNIKPIKVYREIVTIGYFTSERKLQQWAEENIGELEKN